MKRFILASTLISAFCFSTLTSKAQNDSTYYDLGRVRIKKNFTQAITVKGADLEKFPTTNLSDALKVWFYGINTNNNTTIYVVDGNLVNDVNAYSIYDIEEASFIQNALVQLNGAYTNKQLVVITTIRQHDKKSGVVASAMANAIARSNDSDNTGSTTKLYHEYNLGGYTSTDKGRFGLTGNYQRDAQPSLYNKAYDLGRNVSDPSFHRIRLFGYAEQQLFAGTTAGVKLSYVNQQGKTDNLNSPLVGGVASAFESKQNYFNGEVYVTSNIYKGLKNHISFNYNRNRPTIYGYNAGQFSIQNSLDSIKNRTLLLKDNLSYSYTTGGLEIEPMVNLTYRNANTDAVSKAVIYDSMIDPNTNILIVRSKGKSSQLTISPSLNLTYKDIFNLQGGYTRLLSTKVEGSNESNTMTPANYSYKPKNKTLPFVTGSVNTSNLISGLKITGYASYSKSVITEDALVNLINFDNIYIDYDDIYLVNFSNNLATDANSDKIYHSTVLGTKIDLLQNKLSLGYNYEKRKYDVFYQYYDGMDGYLTYNPMLNYTSQRIEATFKTANTGKFNWTSNLNASHIKMDISDQAPSVLPSSATVYGKKMWTGGWANRFSMGNYFAGVDMLYLFSIADNYTYLNNVKHLKPLSLQNIYFGYSFKMETVKDLQVFVNARNLAHTPNSALTDERYYIGGGVKASF